MTNQKLRLTKPLYDIHTGKEVELLHKFRNGNLVVMHEDSNFARTVDAYGYNLAPDNRPDLRKPRIVNKIPERVEYVSIYPNGGVYQRADGPVKSSSYGVENLIQIKITRRGGRIVKKEFV